MSIALCRLERRGIHIFGNWNFFNLVLGRKFQLQSIFASYENRFLVDAFEWVAGVRTLEIYLIYDDWKFTIRLWRLYLHFKTILMVAVTIKQLWKWSCIWNFAVCVTSKTISVDLKWNRTVPRFWIISVCNLVRGLIPRFEI